MENNCFNGLTTVNIELTNRCNKSCFMCGRRKLERDYPELAKLDKNMEFSLVEKIIKELPSGIVVQLHSNGEPTLYPFLGETIKLLKDKNIITSFDTNAKLLVKEGLSYINSKYEFITIADELINNLDTLCISVIENDLEGDEQYEIVKKFLEIKGDRKPFMIYRLLGDIKIVPGSDYAIINKEREQRWYKLSGIVATRVLHSPMGSYDYEKKVTIPEHGICLDLLSHLVIDRYGDVYPCIRFNPNKYNLLGNVNYTPLIALWRNPIRKQLIQEHIKGNRNCSPLCSECDYYGCPTGY